MPSLVVDDVYSLGSFLSVSVLMEVMKKRLLCHATKSTTHSSSHEPLE